MKWRTGASAPGRDGLCLAEISVGRNQNKPEENSVLFIIIVKCVPADCVCFRIPSVSTQLIVTVVSYCKGAEKVYNIYK